jgi:hypothetical protein
MSKITRAEMRDAIRLGGNLPNRSAICELVTPAHVDDAVCRAMTLLDKREAEFAELVKAAVAWDRLIPDPRYRTDEVEVLHKAIQPHLPPLSLADRLDALADNPRTWYQMLNSLRAIAAELREGEK